jgi:hypothetical protein
VMVTLEPASTGSVPVGGSSRTPRPWSSSSSAGCSASSQRPHALRPVVVEERERARDRRADGRADRQHGRERVELEVATRAVTGHHRHDQRVILGNQRPSALAPGQFLLHQPSLQGAAHRRRERRRVAEAAVVLGDGRVMLGHNRFGSAAAPARSRSTTPWPGRSQWHWRRPQP